VTAALEVGAVLQSGGRTVTDAEIALLPAMMGALNPLFHDEVSASASAMKGRILYGPAALGIAVGLTEPFLKDHVLGLIEISHVRFKSPVRVGDTLTASLEVLSLEPREGRPGSVLTTDDVVRNQKGDIVISFGRRILVRDDR
jgi:acyl dehydratase